MATIMHESELLRRALRYLAARHSEKPDLPLSSLIDETGMRFNLGPADAANLERLFLEKAVENPANSETDF